MDDEDADGEGDEEPAAKSASGDVPKKKSKEKLFKVRPIVCTCQHACWAKTFATYLVAILTLMITALEPPIHHVGPISSEVMSYSQYEARRGCPNTIQIVTCWVCLMKLCHVGSNLTQIEALLLGTRSSSQPLPGRRPLASSDKECKHDTATYSHCTVQEPLRPNTVWSPTMGRPKIDIG